MSLPPINLRGAASFLAKRLIPTKERRHTLRWLRSLQAGYLLTAPSPWLSFDAIDYLSSIIHTGSRVFEYGSGGSTLYWLSLGADCVSVEHDAEWYELVAPRLRQYANVDYRLVPPDSDSPPCPDQADPDCYRSEASGEYSFKCYVTQIDPFADQSFDLVVVDGRARPSCIMHGARKVKQGGILVLDNADRDYYLAQTQRFLQDFTCREFIGVTPSLYNLTQTNVYVRNG